MPPKISKPSSSNKKTKSNFTGPGRTLSGNAPRQPATRKGKRKSAFNKKRGLYLLDELRKDLDKQKTAKGEDQDDVKDGDYLISEGEGAKGEGAEGEGEVSKELSGAVPTRNSNRLFFEKFGEGKKLEEDGEAVQQAGGAPDE